MKFILPLLSNLVISFACFAQHSNAIEKKKSTIIVDGLSNDWVAYNNTTISSSNISYSVVNDNKMIYFLFKFPEKNSQLKFLRAGLEIKIDTLGKNKYPISVIFPYSTDRENNDPLSHSFTGITPNMDFESKKQTLLKNSTKIKITNFKNGLTDVMLNQINTINVLSAINFDSTNTLNYEIAFPINMFFESDISTYKTPFNFQFNLLGLPYSVSESSDSRYFENNTILLKSKLAQ